MRSSKINITYDCPENWDGMQAATGGRHCATCDKVITDFSMMSASEIKEFLKSNPSVHCGKFAPEQVNLPEEKRSFFQKYRLNSIAIFAFITSRFFSGGDLNAQDSTEVKLVDPDNEKLKNQKKLYGDSAVFHVEGVVKRRGKKTKMGGVAVTVYVNDVRRTFAYTAPDGTFTLNIPLAHGGEKVTLKVNKRKYKEVVIDNYIADGQELQIRMHKTLKSKFQRHHYVMGRFSFLLPLLLYFY